MTWKQLVPLCACNLVVYICFSGLIGLMPVYLEQLGADPALSGLFLSFAYLCLAVSSVVSGWLSNRFHRRPLLIQMGGLLATPVALGMSLTTSIPVLWVAMGVLWFLIGVPSTLLNILTGLLSEPHERGRNFGLMSLCVGLALFLGTLISGPIADRWGFQTLFAGFAGFFLLIPLLAGFIPDRKAATPAEDAPPVSTRAILGNRTFALLLLASIVAQAGSVIIFLSRPLIMTDLQFSNTAISQAAAMGSLITLPLPLALGWLADRMGRKVLLGACFLAPSLGIAAQIGAVSVWQFWLSSTMATFVGASTVVAAAVTTELFPGASTGSALALLYTTPWIGIVLGLSLGGITIDQLEMIPALTLWAVANLAAIVLLVPVQERARSG